MRFLCFLIFTSIISHSSFAQQRAEAFLVDIFDRKVSIVSPAKMTKKMHAIFTNNSLTRMLGKVQLSDKRIISFVTLEPGQSESVHIGAYSKQKIFYYPMAPAFQAIELKVGSKPYEIPPKN